MSEITQQEFEKHILNCFNPEDSIRNPSSAFIDSFAQKSPDIYVKMNISMFSFSKNEDVLKFVCTQLINFFDTANPQDSILLQISKETINWVKEQLLMLFLKPTFSQSVYNGIVEVFEIISFEELLQSLKQWTNDKNPLIREGAIQLFSIIISRHQKDFESEQKNIINILEQAMKDQQSKRAQKLAIQSLDRIFNNITKSSKHLQQYKRLTQPMFQVLSQSLCAGDYKSTVEILQSMIDIALSWPNFFEEELGNFVSGIFNILRTSIKAIAEGRGVPDPFSSSSSSSSPSKNFSEDTIIQMVQLRNTSLELLLSLLPHFKSKLKKMQKFGSQFVEIVFAILESFKEDPNWIKDDNA